MHGVEFRSRGQVELPAQDLDRPSLLDAQARSGVGEIRLGFRIVRAVCRARELLFGAFDPQIVGRAPRSHGLAIAQAFADPFAQVLERLGDDLRPEGREPRLLHGVVGLQLVQPLGRFLLFPREAQRGAARGARREAAPLGEQLLLGFAAEVGPVCGVVSGFSHACL